MKKVFGLAIIFSILYLTAAKAQLVYFEDFEDDADNDLAAGTAVGGTWSTTFAGGGDVWSQEAGVLFVGDVFLAENIQSEGVWSTNAVTINTSYVSLDLEGSTAFTEAGDYMRAYYRINGGAEILFFDKATSAGFSLDVVGQTAIIAITPGQTIQIVVRIFNNTNNDYFALDDVSISEITTLYSRANTNWNAAGTWSTVGLGGASCACTPDDFTRQVIGGNTVQFTASANTTDLEIQTGGELDWDGNFDLNVIKQGTITVDAGGIVDRDGFADAQIDYDEAYPFSIVNNGTFTIADLDINAGATITITGIGNISVADDILIASTAAITNNLTGAFSVSDQINFETGSDADFTNNGSLSAGSIFFDSDNCGVTNNSTLTVSGNISSNTNTDDDNVVVNSAGATLSFATVSPNDGDFDLLNSGTINQSGNFSNISTADTNFDNLATGVWNWTYVPGVAPDADLNTVLDCSISGNTFNYAGAGTQSVLGKTYYNLTISVSGTKTSTGTLDVNGNFSLQNTAILNIATNGNNITLAGDWSNSGTDADPFIQGGQTVTLDGTATQTISNSGDTQGTEFHNLIISKASGDAVLSNSPATSVNINNRLTLTTGGLSVNGNTLFILNTAVGAIVRTNGYIISETTGSPYSQVSWTMGTTTNDHIFPFGTSSGSYIPFSFNITASGTGASGSISVATYPTPANNLPYPNGVTNLLNSTGSDNSANTVDRFWIITPASYTTNPIATLTFTATAAEVGTITTLIAQRWGSEWENALPGQSNPTGVSALVPGVNSFSPWALSGNGVPLPIELTYFNARVKDDAVYTEWATAQEIDNDFFTIQKTSDLETFYDVENIPGQGNSRENHVYSLIDRSPFTGRSYYRLKQTDFDGNYSYSDLVTVDYDGPSSVSVHAYPNPFDGKQITIELKGVQKSEAVPVQIYNQQGIKMFDLILSADGPGTIQQEVNFNTTLPQGLYIIRAGKTLQLTRKIVVN